MAAISERRPDLRKARRKRLLCTSASLKARHLVMMMAQETMLAMSRMPSTVSAVGPLLWTMSTSALEWGPASGPEGVAGVLQEEESEGEERHMLNFSVNARVSCAVISAMEWSV